MIDFPDLEVAPGTRRGFVPNDAALDFLLALEKLEAALRERLAAEARERARARREHVAREIRRVFAPVARRLPEYDLMDVRAGERRANESEKPAPRGDVLANGEGEAVRNGGAKGEGVDSAAGTDGAPATEDTLSAEGEALSASAAASHEATSDSDEQEEPALFPPGPLARVKLVPSRIRLAPSTERRFRARAEDEDRRLVREGVEFLWSLDGPGSLSSNGDEASYRAPDADAEAKIVVEAIQGELSASAEALVQVRESAAAAARTIGIPEPQPVNAPSEEWRSRLLGSRWEYNEGHRDYLAAAGDESRRLRYLVHLFAKEVVLKNFGSPQEEQTLERMVEVLTHLGDGRGRG